MSMAQTDMILQSLEGIGGGIDTLTDKQQIPDMTSVLFSEKLSANTTKTVVDVTGRGHLCLASLYYMDPGIDFIVEIDGVSFNFLSLETTSQARGIASEENAMKTSNDLVYFKQMLGSGDNMVINYTNASDTGLYLTEKLLKTGYTYSSTANSSFYIVSKVDIPFETLKVSVRNKESENRSRTSDVHVIYRLED